MDKEILKLVEAVAQKAEITKKIIAVAESCTGGLLSAYLTAISGSSKYFDRGFITYSNGAKKAMLGVNKETIRQFGAVSKETAKEMAIGARLKSGTQLAISITGIAGPSGGSKRKPVGTVYIGVSTANFHEAYLFNFSGQRGEIRAESCKQALELILKHL